LHRIVGHLSANKRLALEGRRHDRFRRRQGVDGASPSTAPSTHRFGILPTPSEGSHARTDSGAVGARKIAPSPKEGSSKPPDPAVPVAHWWASCSISPVLTSDLGT